MAKIPNWSLVQTYNHGQYEGDNTTLDKLIENPDQGEHAKWSHDSKPVSILVIKLKSGDERGNYYVRYSGDRSYLRNGKGQKRALKFTSTKKRAMDFARDWMRNHPLER